MSKKWKNFGREWTKGGGGVLKVGKFAWTSYVYHP